MKVNILVKIARQIEGEYVAINAVKGHVDKNKIHEYARNNPMSNMEEIEGIPCYVEFGVLEDIEISED